MRNTLTPETIALLTESVGSVTAVITDMQMNDTLMAGTRDEYIRKLNAHTELLRSILVTEESESEEEGCGLDSDTCGMDTTQSISKEMNEAIMKHSLDNLSNLL